MDFGKIFGKASIIPEKALTKLIFVPKWLIAANTKCSQLRHIEVFYTQFLLFFTQLPLGRWERVEYTTWVEWPKSILPSPLAVHGPLCPVLLVPCPAPVLHLTRIYRTRLLHSTLFCYMLWYLIVHRLLHRSNPSPYLHYNFLTADLLTQGS